MTTQRMDASAFRFPFVNIEPKGAFLYARRLVRVPVCAIQSVRPCHRGTLLVTQRGAFQLIEDYQSVASAIAQGANAQTPQGVATA